MTKGTAKSPFSLVKCMHVPVNLKGYALQLFTSMIVCRRDLRKLKLLQGQYKFSLKHMLK